VFRNYLKTAWRNLSKNKLYSAINVIGLMTGLAACLLIGVYIRHELSYDKFHVNARRIARATMEYGSSGTVSASATTGTKVGPQFKRIFPAIEAYVRTFVGTKVVKREERLFEENRILFADDAFFKVFSFPLVKGNASEVINDPGKVVITQSTADKYFGKENPLNKTLTIGDKDYLVSGVCENSPQNSQLKFDFVTQFLNIGNNVKEEQWWTANWVTYLLLKDGQSFGKLQQQVNEYMQSAAVKKEAGLEGSNFLHYKLEPLTSVHLHSPLSGFEPNGNITYIYMFGVIALLILIIACANYTNLATAQSAGRAGEIGMRKVMGASKRQVFFQFIGESSTITVIASVLAWLLSALLIPNFNEVTGKNFSVGDLAQPAPVVMLLAFALFVSLLAGSYPAMILSGTRVMGILKTGFNFTGSKNLLRRTLIVVQFSISVFLIIYTGIILQQMKFLHNKNLGYNKDQVLVLPVDRKMAESYEAIKDAIAAVPGVEAVTASYETPEFVEWGDGIKVTDENGQKEISLNAMPVDLDFTATLQMQMAAGRDFEKSDFSLMDSSDNYKNWRQPYLINEALAKKIGWTPDQAIGKMIDKGATGPVVGVVKDFNFESLHEPVKPLVLFLSRDMSRTLMVRVNNKNVRSAINRLEVAWKQRVPHRPFEYHFLDEDYNKLYVGETRSAALFTISATVAILLACLGLFGLAAFTTVQRVKEIGIRRVLGASTGSIVMLVSKNFLVLVAISIVIAIPLAWYAGYVWLNDFAFRVKIGAPLFGIAAILVILIAFITVGFQAVMTTMANPVKSLRTE
jgi:putative ABC transport system permease protein